MINIKYEHDVKCKPNSSLLTCIYVIFNQPFGTHEYVPIAYTVYVYIKNNFHRYLPTTKSEMRNKRVKTKSISIHTVKSFYS